MKNIFLLIFLFSISFAQAQSEKHFEEFGELVIRQLSNARYDSIPMIRIREYRDFLRERISDPVQLDGEIYKVNDNYTDMYRKYQNSVFHLIESYQEAKSRGGKFTYSEIHIEPLKKLKDTYNAEIVYLYQEGEIQNEVSLSFDIAWHIETFVLMGEITEDF